MVDTKAAGINIAYFNLYARAEFLRMMCEHSKTAWTDERIEKADWPALKASGRFAFGSLPEVTIDGVAMNQSKAAARALAVKLGYYSTDPDTMW